MPAAGRIAYAVRRVQVGSAFGLGLTLGALLTFPPTVLLIWSLFQIVHTLRVLLENWQNINLFDMPVTNQPVLVNFIALLRLNGTLDTLRSLDNNAVLLGILLTLLFSFFGGLLTGSITTIGGLLYNILARLSGGIVLELEPVHKSSLDEESDPYSATILDAPEYVPSRRRSR